MEGENKGVGVFSAPRVAAITVEASELLELFQRKSHNEVASLLAARQDNAWRMKSCSPNGRRTKRNTLSIRLMAGQRNMMKTD
jgi:hypothetical protein